MNLLRSELCEFSDSEFLKTHEDRNGANYGIRVGRGVFEVGCSISSFVPRITTVGLQIYKRSIEFGPTTGIFVINNPSSRKTELLPAGDYLVVPAEGFRVLKYRPIVEHSKGLNERYRAMLRWAFDEIREYAVSHFHGNEDRLEAFLNSARCNRGSLV